MQNLPTLILIAAMVVVFYLLILRPQKRRQQAIQQTLNSLAAGDRVLLGSGVFGTIVALGERQAVLEISAGVEMTVLKQAIARKVTPADEDAEYDDELDDDEEELQDLPAPEPEPVQPAPLPEQPRSAGADTSRLG